MEEKKIKIAICEHCVDGKCMISHTCLKDFAVDDEGHCACDGYASCHECKRSAREITAVIPCQDKWNEQTCPTCKNRHRCLLYVVPSDFYELLNGCGKVWVAHTEGTDSILSIPPESKFVIEWFYGNMPYGTVTCEMTTEHAEFPRHFVVSMGYFKKLVDKGIFKTID